MFINNNMKTFLNLCAQIQQDSTFYVCDATDVIYSCNYYSMNCKPVPLNSQLFNLFKLPNASNFYIFEKQDILPIFLDNPLEKNFLYQMVYPIKISGEVCGLFINTSQAEKLSNDSKLFVESMVFFLEQFLQFQLNLSNSDIIHKFANFS